MRRPLRIYLSGSIRKGAADLRSNDYFWSEGDEEYIRKNCGATDVELLNPAKITLERNDYALNFGCDLHLVSISDIVLVDARTEKGIGVGAEMMFAVNRGIPVISWAPRDTHYRRSFLPDVFGEDLHDWTHPFIFGLSDYVVESLADAVALIRRQVMGSPIVRKADPGLHILRYATQMETEE
ncbi:hypothetical protein [Mesorhizobium sp.]|uniref:hypothetical protein n=1 Tax=Mesorhizobium sp. TaxID=1871066 RepID=UPI000FE55B6B|nr:hypothetical protein [Mesorhizobium sp.]RWC53042.1 MAG: hypothetical protein EOS56_31245 [Mesorhizobium sp.]RWC53570.1 MAG: hypothetical protein EOS29_29645 [Mesorhizobium sp.]